MHDSSRQSFAPYGILTHGLTLFVRNWLTSTIPIRMIRRFVCLKLRISMTMNISATLWTRILTALSATYARSIAKTARVRRRFRLHSRWKRILMRWRTSKAAGLKSRWFFTASSSRLTAGSWQRKNSVGSFGFLRSLSYTKAADEGDEELLKSSLRESNTWTISTN